MKKIIIIGIVTILLFVMSVNALTFTYNNPLINITNIYTESDFNVSFNKMTTDNLTQGINNLYDNQSWNELYANELYFKLNQSSYQNITDGIPRLYEGRDITQQHEIVDKLYVDTSISALGQRFYMLNTTSGIEDYKLTQASSTITPFDITYPGLTDGQYVTGWISPVGVNFTKLIKGIYDWNVYLEKTAGTRDLRIYWTLNERLNNGTELLIKTSANSDLIDNKASFDVTLTLNDDYILSSNSRIVGKIYAVVGTSGLAPSLTIYGGGNDDSHWEIPTNKEILDTIYYSTSNPNNYINATNGTIQMDENLTIQGGFADGGISLYEGQGWFANDVFIGGELTLIDSSLLNGNIFPATNNIFDIGNTTHKFKNVYSNNIITSTINTGQGDNKVYAMNQDLETTDEPSFTELIITRNEGTGATLETAMTFDNGLIQQNSTHLCIVGSGTNGGKICVEVGT